MASRVLQLAGGVFGGDRGGNSNGLICFRMEQFPNIEVNDLLCCSWRLQSEVVFFMKTRKNGVCLAPRTSRSCQPSCSRCKIGSQTSTNSFNFRVFHCRASNCAWSWLFFVN